MNVKNINPFERHVEKIVLAVAAAGALYLGYLALQPVQVETEGGEPVAIDKVESQVTSAIQSLEQKREEMSRKPLDYKIPNFVEQYNLVANRSPLDPAIVSAAMPRFAPQQAPLTGGTNMSQGNMEVVTPVAPAPVDVNGVAKREVVMVGAAAPQPGQPPVGGTPKDQAWVEITGSVPLGDLVNEMANPALKPSQRLPAPLRRAVVARIEVQRRPQLPGGQWSEWQDVPPSPASNPVAIPDLTKLSETDVIQVVSALDQQRNQILMPAYFAPAPATPAPAAAGNPNSGGGNPVDDQLMNPVDDQIFSPSPTAPPPTAAPARPAGAAAANTTALPFRFYDDSVEPGHVYQYQVRVVYFNPTFNFAQGLKNPAMQSEPFIKSAWVMVPSPIDVLSDLYFYVSAPLGNSAGSANPRASLRVYKWKGGQWYRSEWTVQAGQPLGGSVNIMDKKTTEQVSTPYNVVDVVPGPNGRDQAVILRGPKGELLERTSSADSQDQQWRQLDSIVYKPPVTVTTKPAPRAVPQPRQFNNQPSGGPGPGFHDDQL
jgi:hypothetical protein